MALGIPQLSPKKEHEELHGELVKGLTAGGATEANAKAVAKLLHPHFVKEEEFALPLLGLLLCSQRQVDDPGEAGLSNERKTQARATPDAA